MSESTLPARLDANMVASYVAMTRATPGGWLVEREGLCCVGTPAGTVTTNMAIVVGTPSPAAVAAVTRAAFVARGVPFSLWARAHADAALVAALVADGWLEVARTPAMTWTPVDDGAPLPPTGLVIRRVETDDDRAAYARVMSRAYALYGNPEDSIAALFATMASVTGPEQDAYLGRVDDEPVVGAMLHRAHDVGGVGWVGTVPERFGRGYGAALTWHVMQAARHAGLAVASLQASPMGAPVYRRLGWREWSSYPMLVAPW